MDTPAGHRVEFDFSVHMEGVLLSVVEQWLGQNVSPGYHPHRSGRIQGGRLYMLYNNGSSSQAPHNSGPFYLKEERNAMGNKTKDLKFPVWMMNGTVWPLLPLIHFFFFFNFTITFL